MTDEPSMKIERRPPTVGFWRRWRPRILAVSLGLVVIAALVWGGIALMPAAPGPAPSTDCGGPGSGLIRTDGECVGVTDGSGPYPLSPSLAAVEKKIADENTHAMASGNAVTIAMLNPLTADASTALSADEIRNEVEGAYTAQYRANNTNAIGDKTPLIRLVLANEGSHEKQWPQVVTQLEGMVHDKAPLVAVVGLGVSDQETLDGIRELWKHSIPTIAAIDTADQLHYADDSQGFIRVAASNRQYVLSLKKYLATRPDLNTAMLLYDTNSFLPPEKGRDLFAWSLMDDMQKGFPNLIRDIAPQGFAGISGTTGARPDQFADIATKICAVKPAAVLFAGREADLPNLLADLVNRSCRGEAITVVTAGSDLGILGDDSDELKKWHITVVYAALTDYTDWKAGAPGTPPYFTDFTDAFQGRGFSAKDLEDGGAISTHDSVFAAVRAIRNTIPSATPGATVAPGSAQMAFQAVDVAGQLFNMNVGSLVPGASGDLAFSRHGTDAAASSDPVGKPLPVRSIPASVIGTQKDADIYVTCSGNDPDLC